VAFLLKNVFPFFLNIYIYIYIYIYITLAQSTIRDGCVGITWCRVEMAD
jgi:hypothetical protein